MRRTTLACMMVVACVRGGDATSSAFAPDVEPPAITDVAITCDKGASRWRVEVATDSWAGGAVVAWTADGDYAERHTGFTSIRASPTGDRDLLRADVRIVDDFRPAADGSTAYLCDASLSVAVWVLDLNEAPTDCTVVGPHPAWAAGLQGVPDACQRDDWEDTAVDDSGVDSDLDTDGDTDADTDVR